MRRASKASLGLAAAVLVALVPLQPRTAGATNWAGANGQTGCAGGSAVNITDNRTQTYFYNDLTAPIANAVTWVRTNRIDPTVVTTKLESKLDSLTDAVPTDQDYSTYCGYTWHPTGTLWGLTTCNTLSGSRCQQHYVRFDISYSNVASLSERRGLVCHELGHSLGLIHRDAGSCMNTLGPYGTAYNTHDVNHLSAL